MNHYSGMLLKTAIISVLGAPKAGVRIGFLEFAVVEALFRGNSH
jgi:uncharacterized membrane protein YuzA (DUF378 family)